MPKNNENVNEVNSSNHVNKSIKENIFLSNTAIEKIKRLRNYESGGLYLYQSYICDAMSDLSIFVDEYTSEQGKNAFIDIMYVLRMYNELITALAQEH